MRVITLLVVCASIAGVVLAQDNGAEGDSTQVKSNNARVDKSGILLARCRKDGVTVQQCCKDLGEKDAKLYKGTDGMCCSKSLGMWLPPAHDEQAGKWCSLKTSTELTAGNLKGIADLSQTLKSEMEKLHNQRADSKADLIKAYVAHEKLEKGQKGEAAKQQQLLRATNVKFKEKKQEVDAARDEFKQLIGDFKATRDETKAKIKAAKAKVSVAIKEVFKVTKMLMGKKKDLKEEFDSLDKCNKDKDDEKSGYNALNKQFRAVQKEIDEVNDQIEKTDKEKDNVNAETTKKAAELEDKLKDAQKEQENFQKEAVAAKTEFLAVREELKKAQDNFESKLLSGVSVFLETKDPIEAKCDGLCKEFSKLNVDDGNKFWDAAGKFMKHTADSTKNLFDVLTDVHKRLLNLIREDKRLHDKIMAAMERKIAGLKTRITNLNKKINNLTRRADRLNKKSKNAKRVLDWYLRALEKRLARVQTRIGKYQQRASKINNQMDGVESQIQVMMAKNKDCKKTLALLKTRTADIQKKKEAAEKELLTTKKILEDSEESLQTAKQDGEAKMKKLSTEISRAEEKSEKFETDAMKLKKASASYKKKIAAFQNDEEEIIEDEEKSKKPGFFARAWNTVKRVGKKVWNGAKKAVTHVKNRFSRRSSGKSRGPVSHAIACARATRKKSECNILTHNDLSDKFNGYKKPRISGRVACVWSHNTCRAKRTRGRAAAKRRPAQFRRVESEKVYRL